MNARWRRYLRFFGPDIRADVDDELRFHLESRIADFEARGMTREQAERAASERFGDVKQVEEALAKHDRDLLRRASVRQTLDRVFGDVRLSLRGFQRTPGFLATTVTILGLGIGLAVAMFTVARAVLIKRLPVVDQDQVAVMWTYHDPGIELATGAKELNVFRREGRTITDVAAVAHYPATEAPWIDGDRPLSIRRALVSGNFFTVLGAKPALGRLLTSDDDDAGEFRKDGANAKKVMVLSYGAWQRHFGGDSSIIGRKLTEGYTGWTFTIVGVAPRGLDYPSGVDYWSPLWGGWTAQVQVIAVARLARGATLHAAQSEYVATQQRVGPIFEVRGAEATALEESIVGGTSPVLRTLTVAVALLLLIACLNVGNLLLVRASGRAREFSVRRALGAAYGDIVRQLVIESLTIAALGGLFGYMVARVGLRILIVLAARQLPRLDEIQFAATPALIAIGVTFAAVLLFGILPSLLAARANIAPMLRFDSRSGTESRSRRLARQALVASQIGLATLMLGGSALLLRSLDRLTREDGGYTSDHLMVLWYTINGTRYNDNQKILGLGDRILERLRSVPGITATPIYIPPLLGETFLRGKFTLPGETGASAEARSLVLMEFVGSDFFKVFDIPIVRGRGFTEADNLGSEKVIVVSESVAQRYFPGQDPIGKRLMNRDSVTTIIGVARDARLRDIRHTTPMIFVPWHQGGFQGGFAIRTPRPLASVSSELRAAGLAADPSSQLWSMHSMDELLSEPMAKARISALLMSAFSGVALLLAAIGLYGVMTSLVRDRTREIGIRVALGASSGRVRREVLGRAAVVIVVGATVGLVVTLATSGVLQSLLFNVSPTDPISLGGATLLLVLVGLVAAYLPARRATRIDPVQALRSE